MRIISYLLIFVSFSCNAQSYYKPNILFGSSSNTEIHWWLGDSIIAGYDGTTGPGTSPVAGTAYQSDGTNITEVTSDADWSTVLAQSPSGQGSAMGQFVYDRYNASGKKQIIIPTGFSGSDFVFENNADHWGSTGDLYTPAHNKAINTLTLAHATKLTSIIICLGTNDASGGTSLGTVLPGIDALFDQLVADFPNTPILVIQPGATVATTFTAANRSYRIRNQIRDNAIRLSDVHIVSQLYPYVSASLISGDAVHPSVSGMNMLGSQVARWFTLPEFTNKYVRGLLSSFFDDLSSTRKSALDAFVQAEVANGNYLEDTEYFYFLSSAAERNTYIDWTLMGGFIFNSGGTFIANDGISLDGVNDDIRVLYSPDINTGGVGASYQDAIIGCEIISNSSSGVVGRGFGWGDGATGAVCLTQQTSSINYQAFDNTGTTAGSATSLQNVFYTVRRVSSTGKNLDADFSNINSVSVTAINLLDQAHNLSYGCMNANGTRSQFLALKFRAMLGGVGSTFDNSGFSSNYNTLKSSW